MISANELRNVQLTKNEQGYSVEEVDAVLSAAADTLEGYAEENKELYHKLEVLAAKIEEYRTEEDSIKTALLTAQKVADKISRDAKEESEKLLADSQLKAETAVNEANTKADGIVSQAREYSASVIKQKTDEANELLSDAEKKSNEAINSAKIVAQNILDQAKEISDDLIAKSKEEKEAYEILNDSLRNNAAAFIENLKSLYRDQLEALNAARLFRSDAPDTEAINAIKEDVNSLVNEIDEMQQAIPEEVRIDKEAPEETIGTIEEEAAPEDVPAAEETPVEAPEETDIVSAVEAFSADKITPVAKKEGFVPEITEDAAMEDKSLFEEKAPFEEYFHVNTKDAHFDKTQTISLIPPEEDDDDEPKFKGFFKKKK